MKRSDISVSVLVPVYNTSEYLPRCLESLIGQTLKNIEIICVNDGSTDNSAEILRAYAAKDSRIKIVEKANGGLPSARNAGLDVARGEYVGFVDSDDYVKNNMFEMMYKTAKKQNSEVVICGAEAFPSNPKPPKWMLDTLSPRKVYYKKFDKKIFFREFGGRPFLWRNLIKLDLINRNGLRLREDIIVGEDQAFQTRVFPWAKGISFIPDKLYCYFWYNTQSIMNSVKYDEKLTAHIKLVDYVFEQWNATEKLAYMNKEILQWSAKLFFEDFVKLTAIEKSYFAEKIVKLWKKMNYFKYKLNLEQKFVYKFDYICSIPRENEKRTDAELSIIVDLQDTDSRFEEFKASVCGQTFDNFEVIFVSGEDVDEKAYKWLYADENVRIIEQAHTDLKQKMTVGLNVAVGKYVLFADMDTRFNDENAFNSLIKGAEDGTCGICVKKVDALRDGVETFVKEKEKTVLTVEETEKMLKELLLDLQKAAESGEKTVFNEKVEIFDSEKTVNAVLSTVKSLLMPKNKFGKEKFLKIWTLIIEVSSIISEYGELKYKNALPAVVGRIVELRNDIINSKC